VHIEPRTGVQWAGWVLRIASASLVIITIHYVGFFSALADDYFIVMSTTLVTRVAWELVSTLAFTSLLLSVLLLVTGLLKGILVGIVQSTDVELPADIDEGYSIDLIRISGIYVAVLAVTYFPIDAALSLRLLFFVSSLAMIGLFFLVFFRDVKDDTKWSRFVAPLRHKELAVRALIAAALFVSYFAGKGLALSLMSAEPMQIVTDKDEVRAVILGTTDSALLIKSDDGLELLPIHEINKVVLSNNSSDAAGIAEND